MAFKHCPQCSRKLEPGIEICDCGADVSGVPNQVLVSTNPTYSNFSSYSWISYNWLNIGVPLFKVLAWIAAIAYFIQGLIDIGVFGKSRIRSMAVFGNTAAPDFFEKAVILSGALITSFIAFALLSAASEVCLVLLDIRYKMRGLEDQISEIPSGE